MRKKYWYKEDFDKADYIKLKNVILNSNNLEKSAQAPGANQDFGLRVGPVFPDKPKNSASTGQTAARQNRSFNIVVPPDIQNHINQYYYHYLATGDRRYYDAAINIYNRYVNFIKNFYETHRQNQNAIASWVSQTAKKYNVTENEVWQFLQQSGLIVDNTPVNNKSELDDNSLLSSVIRKTIDGYTQPVQSPAQATSIQNKNPIQPAAPAPTQTPAPALAPAPTQPPVRDAAQPDMLPKQELEARANKLKAFSDFQKAYDEFIKKYYGLLDSYAREIIEHQRIHGVNDEEDIISAIDYFEKNIRENWRPKFIELLKNFNSLSDNDPRFKNFILAYSKIRALAGYSQEAGKPNDAINEVMKTLLITYLSPDFDTQIEQFNKFFDEQLSLNYPEPVKKQIYNSINNLFNLFGNFNNSYKDFNKPIPGIEYSYEKKPNSGFGSFYHALQSSLKAIRESQKLPEQAPNKGETVKPSEQPAKPPPQTKYLPQDKLKQEIGPLAGNALGFNNEFLLNLPGKNNKMSPTIPSGQSGLPTTSASPSGFTESAVNDFMNFLSSLAKQNQAPAHSTAIANVATSGLEQKPLSAPNDLLASSIFKKFKPKTGFLGQY